MKKEYIDSGDAPIENSRNKKSTFLGLGGFQRFQLWIRLVYGFLIYFFMTVLGGVSVAYAQNYGTDFQICSLNNWQSYGRVKVVYSPGACGAASLKSNVLVNGTVIGTCGGASPGQSNGTAQGGSTYVYPSSGAINLSAEKIGGYAPVAFNPQFSWNGCGYTYEDNGTGSPEGTISFYASNLLLPTISISKTASPSTLVVGASSQKYLITIGITNGPTTSAISISDALPQGVTTSGSITTSNGTLSGCPAAGATNLDGCTLGSGVSGTVTITVPVDVAASVAASITNKATVSGGGSTNCSSGCSDSTTNSTLDAIDDTDNKVAGVATTANVSTNDRFPTGSTFTVTGGTCTNMSPLAPTANTTGVLGYVLPVGAASCAVNYKLCAADGSACDSATLTVKPSNPILSLTKKFDGAGRIRATDQFTVQILQGATVVNDTTNSTTTGIGTTVTAGTGTTGSYSGTAGTTYTFNEVSVGSGNNLSQYNTTLSCSNTLTPASGGTDVSSVTSLGTSITPKAGDVISCVITNTPKPVTLKIAQVISGAVPVSGPFAFTHSGTNGWSATPLSSAVVGYPGLATSAEQSLTAAGLDTAITPALPPGWRVQTASNGTYCYDGNASVTGNASTPLSITRTTSGFTIPADLVRAGAQLSCVIGLEFAPPTVTVRKELGGAGRINAADQFTVQLRSGTSVAASATTGGSGAAVTGGNTGAFIANHGATYSVNEVMAAGSISSLSQYGTAVSCENANALGTDAKSVTKLGDSLSVRDGDVITCTITNTPKSPQLRLTKQLGGMGRVAAADQFKMVWFDQAGALVASAITTGSGATVGNATASLSAQPGTKYMYGEEMAPGSASSINLYTYTNSCVNALPPSEGGTNVNVGMGGLFGPLVNGDDITCTVTNAPKPPVLTLRKALGSAGRANAADQFDLAIRTGGTNGTVVASATTSGTGTTAAGNATLNPAAAGTAYTLTESGSAGANLGRYTSTLTCEDSANLQTGLPNNTAFDPAVGYTITPVLGANITCTITNSPKLPKVQVIKLLGGARISDTDQFDLKIFREAGFTVVGQTTTTGAGSTLANATASAIGALGERYTIGELMATGSASRLEQYNNAVFRCENALTVANGGTDVSALGGAGGGVGVWFGPLVAGDDITCRLTNTPKPATLLLNQVIAGGSGAGPFTFDYSVDNGWGTAQITNTAVGYPGVDSTVKTLGAVGQDTVITVTLRPGWRLIPEATVCGDNNGGSTGNAGNNFGVVGTNTLRIPAANVRNASALRCSLGLGLAAPSMQVSKSLNSSNRIANNDQFTVQVRDGSGAVVNSTANSTTQGTGSAVTTNTGVSGVTALTAGAVYSVNEVMASGSTSVLGQYASSLNCSNIGANAFNTPMPTAVGANFSANAGDILSCTLVNTPKPATLSLNKALGGTGRVNTADQFQLAIRTGGVSGSAVASVMTVGTGTTVTGLASLTPAVPGTAYTLTESGAAGTNLAQYTSTISCSDSASLQKGLPSNAAFDPAVGVTVTPVAGANISCAITNTAKPASLSLSKVIGSAGRANALDQFQLAIRTGGVNGTAVSSVTTVGTGTVAAGVATLNPTALGTAYTLTEAGGSGANLAQYTSTISCSDSTGIQSGLPKDAVFNPATGFTITPVAGASISCTITNTVKPTSLSLSKALGSAGRVNAGDQFLLAVRTGGVSGTALVSTTTSGAGATATGAASLTPATAGTTYTLTEAGANGANIAQYTSAITCSDSAGLQTGLPTAQAFNPATGWAITPVAGANISCTITNTAKTAASLSLSKALGSPGRLYGGEQFLLTIRTGGANGTVVASRLTSGSLSQVTGSAVLSAATVGTAYTLNEVVDQPYQGILPQYASTITCSDSAQIQTGLPNNAAFNPATGFTITPVVGANISCTITNTPKPAAITLSKALAGAGRVNAGDQFQLAVRTGGVSGTAVASVTTEGSGTTATGSAILGNATTGATYTLTEGAAAGTNLAQYTSTITCTDIAGAQLQSSLPNGVVFDPAVGAAVTPLMAADIRCTITNTPKPATLRLSKVLANSGRANVNDQFQLAIRTGGVSGTALATVTTTGTITTATGTAVLNNAAAGTAYTFTETAASGANLAQYTSTISCSDSANLQTGLPSNAAFDPAVGLTITPVAGANISCAITNAAKTASLSLNKQLGSGGRVIATDQFQLAIRTSGVNGTAVASVITTGSGASATGVASLTPVAAGTAYTLTEAIVGTGSLAQYAATVSCSDSASLQTGLPSNVPFDPAVGLTITPVAGANISCTITNTAKTGSLSLSKLLSSAGRVNAADQFVLSIRTGGVSGTAVANATTTGAGTTANGVATLSPTSAGTAYTLTEAGTSGANLTQYKSTVTCTDSAQLQTGLPNNATLDPAVGVTITPTIGANISCTITNTPATATLVVSQSLNPGPHRYPITVTYSGNNGWPTQKLSNSVDTLISTPIQSLSASNVATNITAQLPANWSILSISCVDKNAAVTGNPVGQNLASISGQTLTIPAANVRAASALQCSFALTAPRPF